MAADDEGVVSVSTALKQKMAGKLSGGLKTATGSSSDTAGV